MGITLSKSLTTVRQVSLIMSHVFLAPSTMAAPALSDRVLNFPEATIPTRAVLIFSPKMFWEMLSSGMTVTVRSSSPLLILKSTF